MKKITIKNSYKKGCFYPSQHVKGIEKEGLAYFRKNFKPVEVECFLIEGTWYYITERIGYTDTFYNITLKELPAKAEIFHQE